MVVVSLTPTPSDSAIVEVAKPQIRGQRRGFEMRSTSLWTPQLLVDNVSCPT